MSQVPEGPQVVVNGGTVSANPVSGPGAPVAGSVKLPAPQIATPPKTVAQLVKAAAPPAPVAKVPPRPKGIISGNTRDLESGFFRFVLYSETNATKTTTAARFDEPKYVRIIGTRHPEQMVTLKKLGYNYAVAQNAEQLVWLLKYPEAEWPDWGAMPDPERRRTLILDDGTEAVNMLLDSNEHTNQMKTYGNAGKELREVLLKNTLWKPYNFGLTALAKSKDSPRAPDEEIYGPWLPPAMLEMIMSDFEFVFYIDKKKLKLITQDTEFTYQYEGPGGPKDMRSKKRTVYGKTKIDFLDIGKGVLEKEENLDLAAIWKKVRMSQGSVKK